MNLNGENVEDILDSIEQSRRITKLIIAAVQKGSKFEVSQILEHYGLPMTSRLHFGVINVVMEQWVRPRPLSETRFGEHFSMEFILRTQMPPDI